MPDDQNSPSERGKARAAAKARRAEKTALRESSFDALASGFSPEQIAEVRRVGVKTIRREIDRALAERRLDAPDRYVHLQVAPLTKALRLADAMVDRGDIRGMAPLMRLVAELDRYHGLEGRSRPAKSLPPLEAPRPLPAAPLALTRAAPPLDDIATLAAAIAEFGA